jgi:hypothetical protein
MDAVMAGGRRCPPLEAADGLSTAAGGGGGAAAALSSAFQLNKNGKNKETLRVSVFGVRELNRHANKTQRSDKQTINL